MSEAKLPGAGSIQVGEFSDARALLIEDSEPVSRALSRLLGYIGFDVTLIASAQDAAVLLRRAARVDLLVADFALPGGNNGAELALLARQCRRDLPVICVSGYRTDILATYPALAGPRTRALMKPIQSQVFVNAIREVMPRPEPLRQACGG